MITISDKNNYNCCGCGACVDICGKNCIKMAADEEGFRYPVVDAEKCVECGACEKVCPIIGKYNCNNSSYDNIAYAYVSENEKTVKESSSGGAFTVIMDSFLESDEEFAVVGAAFVGTTVKHIVACEKSAAEKIKKSKYVQSDTVGIFKQVKVLLDDKVVVLFSGTPCQVAALKGFLKHDYVNLLTVDIVCHGVPSQIHFDEYLQELGTKYNLTVCDVEFKYKRNFYDGKPNPRTIRVVFENESSIDMDMNECEFLYAYYTGLIHRPSCGTCKFACPERPGDITLGDYWGIEKIHPELNSLRGVSLVRFNNEKGKFLIERFKRSGVFIETDWSFACKENFQLTHPAVAHRNRALFFKSRVSGVSFCDNVIKCKKPDSFLKRAFRKLNIFRKYIHK